VEAQANLSPRPADPPSGVDEYAALLLVYRAELTGLIDTLAHLPAPGTPAEETARVVLEFRLGAARVAVLELLQIGRAQVRQPRPFPEYTVPAGEGFSLPRPATPPTFAQVTDDLAVDYAGLR
jgi:hypothetical protein